MEDFLTFRRMITPIIVQGAFLVSIILCIGFGIYVMWGGGFRILFGLLLMIFGPFVVRIWCEVVLLLFRMNRNLIEIRRKLPAQQQEDPYEDR